jgi:histidine ammonia-lyase
MEVVIEGKGLTIEDVVAVARHRAVVRISDRAKNRVEECAEFLKKLVDSGEAIYGVTTGIGEFARIRISQEQGEALQKKIIYSHAAGVGAVVPEEEVRAAMLLRSNVLAMGYSGVRLSTLETYVEMINKNVVPVVYEKGSLGASGDLSPMSQIAEVVIGEGRAFYKGKMVEGAEALKAAGIKPVKPTFKEGLGLINGSQMFTGVAALCVHDAERLMKNAQITSAVTIDAVRSVLKAFDPRIHELRGFEGQIHVAANVRRMLDGSEILSQPNAKVQDSYSLRCTPQVIGASLDALAWARKQVETEMNGVIDNPIFIPEENANLTGGNFHGQYVAFALDLLGIACAEIANLSERHTNRLLNPVLSGLPDFLVEGRGLNSGMMVAQYSAAALVSENKVLAHPASVDSISVSADQEDHVSMGPIGARKAKEIISNGWNVLAVELMCGVQALDFRQPLKGGEGVRAVHAFVRKHVTHLEEDRVLYPDIERIAGLLRSDEIMKIAEGAVGKLE